MGEDPPHILGILGLSPVTSKNLKPAREEHGDGISDDSSTITSTAGDVCAELATLSHGMGLPPIAMDGATEPASFSSAAGVTLPRLNRTPLGKIARIPRAFACIHKTAVGVGGYKVSTVSAIVEAGEVPEGRGNAR
ncbi:hypothetical protein FB468_1092 [Leucobacter komagatae]|uniref:Uncharacterized protein n=1 Tax=Leucobacter komagatae TaxID=55969 RepID=A0A542Y4S4_9MICO|nr:hypothetical protein FB468_1092 [Leucobacter komagatae]